MEECLQYFSRLLERFLQAWRSSPRDVFPIRVIDVKATLGSGHGGIHFVAPTDWNFHVMSHTWSMEVRQFSTQIGEQILKRRMSTRLYDRCFERADLQEKPAYNHLIEFLQVLVEDGVTHLWFDALCINQTDNNEKSKEIGHMGDYYSRSRGCYALVHGIGQGYGLWAENHPGLLPRWFNRVWTLQEFLFPGSLVFVTELPDSVQKIAIGLMRKANSSAGFCRCCIFEDVLVEAPDARSPLELLPSSPIDGNFLSLDSGINLCGKSSFVCSECGASSLVKRTQHTVSGQTIYMVAREAYLFLLFLDSFFILQQALWMEILRTTARIAELIKSLEQPWDLWKVLAELGRRECTHDEDRVLSILGLLGVGGERQLRTGQSLEKQLVAVAKFCDPDLLLKLCAMNLRGGVVPGMSWAPDFRDPAAAEICGLRPGSVVWYFGHRHRSRCCGHLEPGRDMLPQPLDIVEVEATMAKLDTGMRRLSDFNPLAKVVKVTDDGMIMLECKAACGEVMRCERLSSKDREAMEKTLLRAGSEQECSNESRDSEEFRLWQEAGGEIESPRDQTPTHCIHFHDVGSILPLVVNLMWNEDPLGAHREPHIPELVMAYAVQPWHPIFLQLSSNQGALEALQSTMQRLEDNKLWIHLQLWALQLGTVANGSYSVAMLCVEKRGSTREDAELHKVGIFVLPTEISDPMFGISSQGGLPKYYKVGGFGPDLSEFVTISASM